MTSWLASKIMSIVYFSRKKLNIFVCLQSDWKTVIEIVNDQLPKLIGDQFNRRSTVNWKTGPQSLWALLTTSCSQSAVNWGLCLFVTTARCMSSSEGCKPTSASNGIWYCFTISSVVTHNTTDITLAPPKKHAMSQPHRVHFFLCQLDNSKT